MCAHFLVVIRQPSHQHRRCHCECSFLTSISDYPQPAKESEKCEPKSTITIGLLPGLPRSHPGGSTNTSRLAGRSESGGYESELRATLCHCLDPRGGVSSTLIIKYMTHTGKRKTKQKGPVFSFVSPSSFSFLHFSPFSHETHPATPKATKKGCSQGPRQNRNVYLLIGLESQDFEVEEEHFRNFFF